MKTTRREALVTIAGVAAASSASAQVPLLSSVELDQLKALVDAIIPRTETPGASDAGVPAFIDRRLAASAQMAERFRAGLKEFEAAAQAQYGKAFAALSTQQQLEHLNAHAQDAFVRAVKGMTVDGYYTSREGLAEELGWHGNTYLTEFKGCTHPEHQA